ncbi:lysosomal-associated transmembrane protein 4A-like isoform X1 [Homalodisca vitripennis]|uniref:lysosomal-associated transmembrane protein 4A-like isoform X1 n=1 Tax=Homalodisca vitripennis TaxID=197043 RepID=UPI001EEC6BA2|nr:lysosomal-associated transmembrane protein 4A-like isoform X1 [Homalodisca vitripennis]
MVTTNNCCFCFSLRTGSLIIGWLHLISSTIGIIGYLIMYAQDGNDQDYAFQKSHPGIFWADAILTAIKLIVAITFLYGIYTEQKQFILYYVYFLIITILVSIIFLVMLLSTDAFGAVALVIIIFLIGFLYSAYLAFVVYSLYKEMEGHN